MHASEQTTSNDERAARLDACLAISALCLELAQAGARQRARRDVQAHGAADDPNCESDGDADVR